MNQEELIDALFKEFDRNGDGELSRGEFVELVRYMLGEHGIKTSSRIFDHFDEDHDNGISREELGNLIEEYVL